MAEDKKKDPRTVQLKRVRLAFSDPLLEKAAAVRDGKETHNCVLIIQQADGDDADSKAVALSAQNLERATAAIKAAGDEKWGKPEAFKSISEDNPKRVALRKGERFKNGDDEIYKGFKGNWGISAAGPGGGKKRPDFFDRHRVQVDERELAGVFGKLFYSGCFVDAIVSFYGTDEGGRGIFCSVDAIRSHQEGAALGGGGYRATADDWDEFDDDDDFGGGTSSGASGTSNAGSSDKSDFG